MVETILKTSDWNDELLDAATDRMMLETQELQSDIDLYRSALKTYRQKLKDDAAHLNMVSAAASQLTVQAEDLRWFGQDKVDQRARRHSEFLAAVPARFAYK